MEERGPDRGGVTPPRPDAADAPDNSFTVTERLRELEQLCADLYEPAVEVGLPQPLLNRLWMAVSRGRTPHAFDYLGEAAGAQPVTTVDRAVAADGSVEERPLPSVPLTHRPENPERRPGSQVVRELQPLAQRRSVLVVDDEPLMLNVLVKILSLENYELLVADSGPDALSKLETCATLDLLVTDYLMPGMTGRELAGRVRARFPGVRVLYQTGYTDLLFEQRQEVEAGAAFIEKPFTARGLLEAARLVQFGAIHSVNVQPGT